MPFHADVADAAKAQMTYNETYEYKIHCVPKKVMPKFKSL